MNTQLTYTIAGNLFDLAEIKYKLQQLGVACTRQGSDSLYIRVNNPTPEQIKGIQYIIQPNSGWEEIMKLKRDMERASKYLLGNSMFRRSLQYIDDVIDFDYSDGHYYPVSNTNREHYSESSIRKSQSQTTPTFSNQSNNKEIPLSTDQSNNNITISSNNDKLLSPTPESDTKSTVESNNTPSVSTPTLTAMIDHNTNMSTPLTTEQLKLLLESINKGNFNLPPELIKTLLINELSRRL